MSDIAHLGHVEVLTDRFDESLDFFTRVYGLKPSAQEGDSAYLRAWDDYEFHSLKLTRAETTGVGHISYRAASPEALERRVAAIEASGYPVHGWHEGDLGHGRAFRFEDPFGHLFEIYYDTTWYKPPEPDRGNKDQREYEFIDPARQIEHLARGMEHEQAGREVTRGDKAQGQRQKDREKRSPDCQLNCLHYRLHETIQEPQIGRKHAQDEVTDPRQPFHQFRE